MTTASGHSSPWHKLSGAYAEGGIELAAHRLRGRIARARRELHRRLRPTPLQSLIPTRWETVRSSRSAIYLMLNSRRWPNVSATQVEELLNAAEVHLADLAQKPQLSSAFSEIFDVETQSAAFLYCLCRLEKPEVVVETGVARGMSTSMILAALHDNSAGRLISFDVTDQVGVLVPEHMRDRWDLRILRGTDTTAEFIGAMQNLRAIDIFLHDSDHTANHQRFEYQIAIRCLSNSGILLSDDVEGSDSLEKEAPSDWNLLALTDRRKAFGVAYRP